MTPETTKLRWRPTHDTICLIATHSDLVDLPFLVNVHLVQIRDGPIAKFLADTNPPVL